jgi:hypothetical protein
MISLTNESNTSYCVVIKKSKGKKCVNKECKKQPTFNVEGKTVGLYCALHKKENMMNVKNKRCLNEGCKTRPTFNMEGETVAYCALHKKDGMMDVKHKTCLNEECKKQPAFNTEGETGALYCALHKKENMVNVKKNKTCLTEGCKKQPAFNTEGETVALYCATHKTDGMINVISKTCLNEGCKKQPAFNVEGETVALYCALHKKENMINVKDKTCLNEGCKTRPIFNVEGETVALYCATHKKENMVDVKNKTCLSEGCKKQPAFNTEGETVAIYCFTHKTENMVNVISKTCITPMCTTLISNPKYRGNCRFCFMNKYPDEPIGRNYKTKETNIKDHIVLHFNDMTWVWDKRVQDGCSQRRPDLLCDLGDTILIVEIDENQHTDYDSTCEIARMNELSTDVYFRPIIMIRFNPDDYYNALGEKVKSCWTLGKDGIVKITKKNEKQWNGRLLNLTNTIEMCKTMRRNNDEMIKVISLFYDV